MEEFDEIVEIIERDLDAERCLAALPRLLELSGQDESTRARAYLLAARCLFVARENEAYAEMLQRARDCAAAGSLEAKVRVVAIEASLLTSSTRVQESASKLEFAIQNLDLVSDSVRSLVLSIRGRNEALMGSYAQAIEYSQECIDLGPELSSAVSFANGTIALVFQVMGRIQESEQFGLEQIRILTERGSKNWVASMYSFLSAGAASIQDWKKAQEYEEKAMEMMSNTQRRSSVRALALLTMSDSQLEHGDYTQALAYGREALAVAKEESNTPLRMNALLLLGRIHFMKGELNEALAALHIPFAQEAELGDNQRMNLFRWLAATYKALDRKAEAFDICWRLWELQTDFDARTREALLRYHRALEQKIHAQKTSILSMKAAQMERELALTASQLAAQTDLLGRFRNDLREIVRQSESDAIGMKKVKDKLKALPCEQLDWTQFDSQFSTVHPEFKSKLEAKHPDLTRAEVKVCSLTRLKLTGEEIARLLCLSPRSIESHRYNIRIKLGLKTEQKLGTYLASL